MKSKITKTCEYCGIDFMVIPSLENRRFHNRQCSIKYRRGINHPLYKRTVSQKTRDLIAASKIGKHHKPTYQIGDIWQINNGEWCTKDANGVIHQLRKKDTPPR